MADAVVVHGLKKSFGGVPVLKDITFAVEAGTVTVLAGENGAGKSTLFKILTGQIEPDDGTVDIGGRALDSANPHLARELGMGIVPQELAPYDDLTVAENLFVGKEPRRWGFIMDKGGMTRQASTLLREFGVDIDPTVKMHKLSVAYTQIVEIVKATTSNARVILMDEPTSSIPAAEVERLYEVVRQLTAQGVAIIYTTHRMAEIEAIADRVVVLRDGSLVLDEPSTAVTPEAVVTAMIGRELGQLFPAKTEPRDEVVLRVDALRRKEGAPPVSLEVRSGEILGVGGLVGAGRSALLNAVFGARHAHSGSVSVRGVDLGRPTVSSAIGHGIAYVPEDRKKQGIVLSRSILDNLTLPHLRDYTLGGVLRSRKRSTAAKELAEDVRLKYRGLGQLVETLSGGNQQKIVIARWLDRTPQVLLLDEPTRGVDVGARGEIYRIISELAAEGLAVVLVSSDMPELIGMSTRVCVMRGGAITGELTPAELASEDAQSLIFHYATGEAAALTSSLPTITSKVRKPR